MVRTDAVLEWCRPGAQLRGQSDSAVCHSARRPRAAAARLFRGHPARGLDGAGRLAGPPFRPGNMGIPPAPCGAPPPSAIRLPDRRMAARVSRAVLAHPSPDGQPTSWDRPTNHPPSGIPTVCRHTAPQTAHHLRGFFVSRTVSDRAVRRSLRRVARSSGLDPPLYGDQYAVLVSLKRKRQACRADGSNIP